MNKLILVPHFAVIFYQKNSVSDKIFAFYCVVADYCAEAGGAATGAGGGVTGDSTGAGGGGTGDSTGAGGGVTGGATGAGGGVAGGATGAGGGVTGCCFGGRPLFALA